jgi:hypothetical protein
MVDEQVVLNSNEVSTIQLHLIPQVQETMAVSLLLHWLTVTFAEVPPPEDFSSQLSSLRLGKDKLIGLMCSLDTFEKKLLSLF